MNTQPEMNWSQCLAQRTDLMRSSALRELMKVNSRPGIISFAGGLPAAELFPIERIKSALAGSAGSSGRAGTAIFLDGGPP